MELPKKVRSCIYVEAEPKERAIVVAKTKYKKSLSALINEFIVNLANEST